MIHDGQTTIDGVEVEIAHGDDTLRLGHHILLLCIGQARHIVDVVHQQITTAYCLPYKVVGIRDQRMVGVGNISRRQQTTVVLTVGSTIAEMLLVAVGQRVHLRIPVTGTPRGLGGILEGQTIVLQHIATYKELLGVFGTGKHRVE